MKPFFLTVVYTIQSWRLGEEVKKSLSEDRRRQADEAGAEVEALVKADPPLIQEAWYRLKGWYKAAVDRAPPPLERSSSGRRSLVNCSLVPPMKAVSHLLYEGRVRLHQGDS